MDNELFLPILLVSAPFLLGILSFPIIIIGGLVKFLIKGYIDI